jgi:hypothetical protein
MKTSKMYSHGIPEEEAFDYWCMAERKIVGGSPTRVYKHWAPYALLAGTRTLEEVNRVRSERGGTWTLLATHFGFPIGFSVKFSFEPVDPTTLETIRDPQIIEVEDSSTGNILPEKEWKGMKKYEGHYARG